MSTAELVGMVRSQAVTIDSLKHQLEWFKNQMFGTRVKRLRACWYRSNLLGRSWARRHKRHRRRSARWPHTRRMLSAMRSVRVKSVPFFDEVRADRDDCGGEPRRLRSHRIQFREIRKKVSCSSAAPGSVVASTYGPSSRCVRHGCSLPTSPARASRGAAEPMSALWPG